MYFPGIIFSACLFLTLFLTIQSEREDLELLALTRRDKSFGQRRTVTDAGNTTSIRWQKSLQKFQKPKETLSTLAAKSRAKDIIKIAQNSSEFQKQRTVEPLPVTTAENPKLSEVTKTSDLFVKPETVAPKNIDAEPVKDHQTTIVNVSTTEATFKSIETSSTPSENNPKLFDVKNKRRRKMNWKMKVRRKSKIRKPHLTNDKKEEQKSSESIADPGSGSPESISVDDKDTSDLFEKKHETNIELLNLFDLDSNKTFPELYEVKVNNSKEETTTDPLFGKISSAFPDWNNEKTLEYPKRKGNEKPSEYPNWNSDENPLEYPKWNDNEEPLGYPKWNDNEEPLGYPKWNDENLKQTTSYDYPTEDTLSPIKNVEDKHPLNHTLSILEEEERQHLTNGTSVNTTEPFPFKLKSNGIADDRRAFPLMRPPIRKPKTKPTTAKPPKHQIIQTYTYGKPEHSNINVYKRVKDGESGQVSGKRTTSLRKAKNIWIKQKPTTVSKVNHETDANKGQLPSDIFSTNKDEPDNFLTFINDDSTVTNATPQNIENNQNIQSVSENGTFSPYPFHTFTSTLQSSTDHEVENHYLNRFMHFGLRSNLSMPIKRDILPLEVPKTLKKVKDNIRQPVFNAPIPPLHQNGVKRKGFIKSSEPSQAPLQFDLEPSENKQYFVHIFNRVGEYAKPHISFGDESIFAENSPVNYLTSLKMQWEGENSRKAKVITEAFQGIKKSSVHEAGSDITKVDDMVFPKLSAKPSEVKTDVIEPENGEKIKDKIVSEETGQASEKEIKVDQNISTVHKISKRSLKIGESVVRTAAENTPSTTDLNSYGYVIQPFYIRNENTTNLPVNILPNQLNKTDPMLVNLTNKDIAVESVNNGISVVTSISVIYNILEESHEPNFISTTDVPYVSTSHPTKPYYTPDSHDKTIASYRTFYPTPATKAAPTSVIPKRTTTMKNFQRKKPINKLVKKTSELPIQLADKKPEKGRKQRKADLTRRFDLLRLSATTTQTYPQEKIEDNKRLNKISKDEFDFSTIEYSTESTSFSPEDITDQSYQVATPILKTEASESVEHLESHLDDSDMFEEQDEDGEFESVNPLDSDFYSSIPIVEDFTPATENVEMKELNLFDETSRKRNHDNNHALRQEKKHAARESEYRKNVENKEKDYVKNQKNIQDELNRNQKFDPITDPFSDWANYGVFYDHGPIVTDPPVKKTVPQEKTYVVDPFPRKMEEIDNAITMDTFTNPPQKKYPTLSHIPKTSFRCKDERYLGYYADKETNCQVFHLCLENGEKHSFLCPKSSLFNQHLLTCDWWHRVDCKHADDFYELNNKMYPQRNHFSISKYTSKHKGEQFHHDRPKPTIELPKVQHDRKWSTNIKEQDRKHHNDKIVVQPKAKKFFRNPYDIYYERPQLSVFNQKDEHINHQNSDKTTEAPINYSDWLKEKGSVFGKMKDSYWESAVTPDLPKHVDNRIRQKQIPDDDGKLQENKTQEKKFHNNIYYHRPQVSSIQHQQRSTPEGKPLQFKSEVPTSKPFPGHLIRDQTRQQHTPPVKLEARFPPKVTDDSPEKRKTATNGYYVFPSRNAKTTTASNGGKVDAESKETTKKGTSKQGFWTSEKLRKTKKFLPKPTLSTSKERTSEQRIPSSSLINRVNTKVIISKNQHEHDDCNHDDHKNPYLQEHTHRGHSNHNPNTYKNSNALRNVDKNPPKGEFGEHEELIKKIPGKIVAIKYSKDGSVKPVNIYLEQENLPHDHASGKDVTSSRSRKNENNMRGRLNSKVPEVSYTEDDGVKNVKLQPIRVLRDSNYRKNLQTSPGQRPIHPKTRNGYQFYYEVDPGKEPAPQKYPVVRQYNGHQNNADKILQAEFEKGHPDLFNVAKVHVSIEPEYHEYSTPTNKGNIHIRGTPYNHELKEINSNTGDHSIDNLNLFPLHLERKRIVNSGPYGHIIKIGPIVHGPIDAQRNKETFIRSNDFQNEDLILKSLLDGNHEAGKYNSPTLVERKPYSVPHTHDDSYLLENAQYTKGPKKHYGGHGQGNLNEEFLPTYRENPVRDDVREMKFHIIRPYGQNVHTGSFSTSDNYGNNDEKLKVNFYKNRQTIPSTKTGQYLETTYKQPHSNDYLGGHGVFHSLPKSGRYYGGQGIKSSDLPNARKIYYNTNSKVHFPRLNFKFSQSEDPGDRIFPRQPETLILKTLKTGPVAVQDDVNYNQHSGHYTRHNLRGKSKPISTENDSHLGREYTLNSQKNLGASSEERSLSEENLSNLNLNSEYEPKPFHIIRPYGQVDKTYYNDNLEVKHHHHDADSLYLSNFPAQHGDSHLYKNNYNKDDRQFFKSYQHPQRPNISNNQTPRRDITKHFFTPDQNMRYYSEVSNESTGRNTGAQNSHVPSAHNGYKTKSYSTSSSPVIPSITQNGGIGLKKSRKKIPLLKNSKPSAGSELKSINTKGSRDLETRGIRFEKTSSSPSLPTFYTPTEDYTTVTRNNFPTDTTVPQAIPNFSPSPDYRQPLTTAKLEDYTHLEQEAEKKAEEYVKKLKTIKS